MAADWIAEVRARGEEWITVGEVARLLRCAEALERLVVLDQAAEKYEGDWHTEWAQAWQEAEAALRGEP